MKYIEKEKLKNGDVFVSELSNCHFLNKEGSKFSLDLKTDNTIRLENLNKNSEFSYNNIRIATPEEKYWLEVCIAANSFISYDEAMKTFIPEYVEVLDTGCRITGTISSGKIYKCSKNVTKAYYYGFLLDSEHRIGFNKNEFDKYLKPSTKEAYDAQFIVKEPEFVLPEKWCIKNTNKIISDYFNKITKSHNVYNKIIHKNKYLHSHNFNGIKLCNTSLCSFSNNKIRESHTEITLEQFKKYVLKEQLEEPKDKILKLNTLKRIQKVESLEGAIYQLGDKITVFTKDSKNKGKLFTITGFRWSKDKSQICALTSNHWEYGIGLDKIELYSEPVVKELSLLEQAKLKYVKNVIFKPIGVMPINIEFNSVKLSNDINIVENSAGMYIEGISGWIYCKSRNKWAEIVNEFVLPIEQHVLHNGFKIGDIINNGNYIIYDLQYLNGHSVAFYKIVETGNTSIHCRILTKNIVK